MAKSQRVSSIIEGKPGGTRQLAPLLMQSNPVNCRRKPVMLEQSIRFASYITLIMAFLTLGGNEAYAVTQGALSLTATGTITAITPASVSMPSGYATFAMMKGTTTKSQAINTDMCLGASTVSGGSLFSATSTWKGVNLFTSLGLGIGTNPSFADCTTAGYYYLILTEPVSGGYFRPNTTWRVYYNGTGVVPENPNDFPAGYEINFSSQYETRFTDVIMGSATTSVDFDVSFYIDADEATSTQSDKNPTMVRVRYAKNPSTDYSGYSVQIDDATSPGWGYGTTSFSLNLDPSSTYDVSVSFANGGTALTGIVPFPLAYVYFTVVTDTNGAIATTSDVEFYDAVEEQAFAYQPCGITDIGGCISNALLYAFVPSNESLDRFASIEDDLATRAPFVYVYQLPEYWDLMFETANSHSLTVSASTTIGTITFISEAQLDAIPLTNTVRTIVGYLLWVMLAFTLYVRVTRLFNQNQQTV